MNARERFAATMQFASRDRCPIMDFGFWDETLVLWREQGLPEGADPGAFFGMDPQWIVAPINVGLCPGFEHVVLEDRGDTEVVRDAEGVTKEQGKFLGSIPRHLDHALKDRRTWERDFRPRLEGGSAARYPVDWAERAGDYRNPSRDYPLGVNAGSLYGWLRNWMGMENLSLLVYDDRPLFEEMVKTVADAVIDTLRPALAAGIRPEYALLWEDMCYRAGPLLSPPVFAEVLVPHYTRITEMLREFEVDVVIVDCDGDISQLLPLWLKAGVNTMFPIEVGAWGSDPVKYRAQYGRELLMIGGVSKRILSGPTEGITREIERLAPLVDEGGYIPTPDHRVPADVPLTNYLHYLIEARRVWGRNLANLAPMGAVEPARATPRYEWHLDA
jgi:uroporphyrinogen decarboxylase